MPVLRALIESDADEVVAVVCQPDKPAGRGRKLTAPPTKKVAEEMGIAVLQPAKVRGNEELFQQLRALELDVAVVIAYGKILPPELLEIPKHGCINVHASLLPKYRGAAPYQWAIIRGETHTGVTTMQMDEGMDTGDILLVDEIDIDERDTAGMLHDKLSSLGVKTLLRTLDALRAGELESVPQDDEQATYAPLMKKEDGRIDWNAHARTIVNLVRGVTPWPGAFTQAGSERLKIHDAVVCDGDLPAGEVLVEQNRIFVGCGSGRVEILELQGEGRKRMNARDFLNGHTLPPKLG